VIISYICIIMKKKNLKYVKIDFVCSKRMTFKLTFGIIDTENMKIGVRKYILQREYREKINRKIKYRERKKSFGRLNPDKTFYVARIDSAHEGFGSVYKNMLSLIAYADENGWIPVVDYKNMANRILQGLDWDYRENAWEYYFKQVSPYSLDEVYKSKNVILGNAAGDSRLMIKEKERMVYFDDVYRAKLIDIKRKYYSFADDIQKRLDEELKLFADNYLSKGKVLGVSTRLFRDDLYEKHLRGEKGNDDYANYIGQVKNTRRVDLIRDIHNWMNENDCKYVYLVDDSSMFEKEFEKEFGESLIITKRRYIFDEAKGDFKGLKAAKEQIYGYMTTLYLLSHCNELLADQNSTTTVALLMNEMKYDKVHIYDNGVYE